jgi:hypothetical protein
MRIYKLSVCFISLSNTFGSCGGGGGYWGNKNFVFVQINQEEFPYSRRSLHHQK